jgi:MFS family permease
LATQNSKIPRLWPFKNIYFGWGVVAASVMVSMAQVPMYGPVLLLFVKPIGDDLGWSRGEISVAFAVGSLFGSGASAIVGSQLDRYGARVAIIIAGMVITGALMGLAVMQEPWHFWVLFGMGRTAALAGISLGTSVAAANWFVRKRGRAISFLGIGLRGGQALFPLFIAPIIFAFSWRHAYMTLAAIAFMFIVIPAWLFIRRRPEDMGLLPDGDEPSEATAASLGAEAGSSVIEEASWTLAEARRTRSFWLLVLAMSLVFFAQTGTNLHAVANFQDRGVAGAFAGLFVFLFAGAAAISAYGWGVLMDRYHIRWMTLAATLSFVAAMTTIVFADTMTLAVIFALLFGLGAGGWTASLTLLFSNYFGRAHLGSIRGFAQVLAAPLGAAGPISAGYIQTYTGSYRISFEIFLGTMVVVAIALLLAVPPKKPVSVTT